MRLIDLEPEWIFEYNAATHGMRRASDPHSHIDYGPDPVDTLLSSIEQPQAQGIMFLCPTCFRKNNGPVGTEHVLCWFSGRGVPDDALPGPGRWAISGTGFNDLSLSPSVNVDHEHWHGFITNGDVTP